MTLGYFLKIRCDLSMDNNVTFVIVEIHYKNVHLWNPQMPFYYSLQLPPKCHVSTSY